jgi:hypothetical protein
MAILRPQPGLESPDEILPVHLELLGQKLIHQQMVFEQFRHGGVRAESFDELGKLRIRKAVAVVEEPL